MVSEQVLKEVSSSGKSQTLDNMILGLENFNLLLGTVAKERLKGSTAVVVFVLTYGPD